MIHWNSRFLNYPNVQLIIFYIVFNVLLERKKLCSDCSVFELQMFNKHSFLVHTCINTLIYTETYLSYMRIFPSYTAII